MKRNANKEIHNIVISIVRDGDDIAVTVDRDSSGTQTKSCAAMQDELFERINEAVNFFMIEVRNPGMGS